MPSPLSCPQGGEEGSVAAALLLLPGAARRLPAPRAAAAAAGPGLPGALHRERPKLHPGQQLCPILLPHVALHQRAATHLASHAPIEPQIETFTRRHTRTVALLPKQTPPDTETLLDKARGIATVQNQINLFLMSLFRDEI